MCPPWISTSYSPAINAAIMFDVLSVVVANSFFMSRFQLSNMSDMALAILLPVWSSCSAAVLRKYDFKSQLEEKLYSKCKVRMITITTPKINSHCKICNFFKWLNNNVVFHMWVKLLNLIASKMSSCRNLVSWIKL